MDSGFLFDSIMRNLYLMIWTSNLWGVFPVEQSVKFQDAAKKGNLVPLFRSIFSDHLTPVLAYRCLVKEDDRDAPSFLFESVEAGLQASSVVRLFPPSSCLFVIIFLIEGLFPPPRPRPPPGADCAVSSF